MAKGIPTDPALKAVIVYEMVSSPVFIIQGLGVAAIDYKYQPWSVH